MMNEIRVIEKVLYENFATQLKEKVFDLMDDDDDDCEWEFVIII